MQTLLELRERCPDFRGKIIGTKQNVLVKDVLLRVPLHILRIE